jgi:hypothetical protein
MLPNVSIYATDQKYAEKATVKMSSLSNHGRQLEPRNWHEYLQLLASAILGILIGYRDVLSSMLGIPNAFWGSDFGLVGNGVVWAGFGFILGLIFPHRPISNAICLVGAPAIVSQAINIWRQGGIYNLFPFVLFLIIVYLVAATISAVVGAAVRRRTNK